MGRPMQTIPLQRKRDVESLIKQEHREILNENYSLTDQQVALKSLQFPNPAGRQQLGLTTVS